MRILKQYRLVFCSTTDVFSDFEIECVQDGTCTEYEDSVQFSDISIAVPQCSNRGNFKCWKVA